MHHESGLRDQHISLEGKGDIDRLASPLILRPLSCSDGAVGLAAILEWEPMDKKDGGFSPPGGLELKSPKRNFPVESKLTASEAAQIPPMGKVSDVLQAFLDFLTNK
jgi:CRISPR-associated protein Cmr1